MAQKLWEKSVQVNKDIERFTVGRDREMDLYLAKHDVLGSMAHITMLESIGLLTKEELRQLLAELKKIYAMAERGEFVIEEGVEDVHSQVELMLTRNLGDIGKKIHSGRSRNDQVLLDLKLFTRAEIKEVAEAVEQLFHVLVMQSERYKDVLMPGYTHLQIAMPSSFGLWFGAYAESLVDDMMFLQAAFKMCNRNPLGSAAGYGSSFPLNRTMTTRLLGFDSLNYNVVYAQMGRGKMERNVAFALASVAGTISKLAFDACMFNSQNFGFVKLPDDCTTGSSIILLVRHDAGAGSAIVRQLHKTEVLTVEHTCVKSQFRYGSGHTGKGESYITLHLATPHLGIHYVVVEGIKSQKTGSHRTVQRERGTVSRSRTQRIAVAHLESCLKEHHIVHQALGVCPKPKSERRRHGYLQVCITRHQYILVAFALHNQHMEQLFHSLRHFLYLCTGKELQIEQHLVVARTSAVYFLTYITQVARQHKFHL